MNPKLKKIIVVILVIVALFLVWAIFLKPDPEIDPLISGSGSDRSLSDSKLLGAQITQALDQINSLELDRTIFDNLIFNSLVDRSQQIEKEPIGRRNPFAPLSDTSVNFDSSVGNIDFSTTGSESEATPTTTPSVLEVESSVQTERITESSGASF